MPWWLWLAAPAAAVAAVLAFYALRGGPAELGPPAGAPGVVHVHGLGVNPADGDLYAATHGGLFRITGRGRATRIANRYQDTMGFTVAGPDHFYASGHPDMREELPPLLGLLESRDAGKTWITKSLLGEADFHALRYVHRAVYGYDSTGSAFMVSPDGRRWDTRSRTVLRDFVVDPANPDLVLSTTPDGLQRSADGGRTWKPMEGPPEPLLLDWPETGRLWLVDLTGRVHLSRDAGSTWELRGRVEGPPAAFHAAADRLYIAVEDGILVSRDEGATWTTFYREGDDAR